MEFKVGDFVRLDTDNWYDVGLFELMKIHPRENSTAVEVELRDIETNEHRKQVVAYHQIYRGN